MVVHHLDLAAELLRQADGRAAGGAETAGHGQVDHLVIVGQQALPEGQDIAGSGLGGGDLAALFQVLVKGFGGQIDPLVIRFAVQDHGHGQNVDAVGLTLGGEDAAVGVGKNGYVHKNLL